MWRTGEPLNLSIPETRREKAGDCCLDVRNLSVNFSGLWAVRDLELQTEASSITGLIGPNGSGKTTVINVISGLVKPASGRIIVNGRDILGTKPHQIWSMGVGRTFQIPQVFDGLSVLENVMVSSYVKRKVNKILTSLPIRLRRCLLEEEKAREDAMQKLELVGLKQWAHVSAATLPGGKKRILEIARALAGDVTVLLLLDEPTAGMNAVESAEVMDMVASLKEHGLSVLLVEHNVPLVTRVADKLYVIAEGRKIYEGAPDGASHNAAVIQSYLGAE